MEGLSRGPGGPRPQTHTKTETDTDRGELGTQRNTGGNHWGLTYINEELLVTIFCFLYRVVKNRRSSTVMPEDVV